MRRWHICNSCESHKTKGPISENYPRVDAQVNSLSYPTLNLANTSAWRHYFNLNGRYALFPKKRVSAYGQAGLNVSFGRVNGAM